MSTPVEKIKERLSIDEVVGSYIKLDKAGKNFKGKCPFHNEKTPSFFVSPDRGSYYCFGCNAKGDIFSFVEQFEGLDFMGSLKLLAERAGIPLTFEKTETKSEKERLFAIMEDAAKFFEGGMAANDQARKYVEARGLIENTVARFRIGFVPNDWRLLYNFLRAKSYSDAEIEKAGLAKRAEDPSKGFYDRFRGRIIFPITDSSGRVIAFTGRILEDDGKSAKYLNSPDTPLFNKSTVLFGIDKAKSEIRARGFSILVEGQMDLIMSHQAGVGNAVAVSGTALTEEMFSKENIVNNLGIVRRLSSNIILAFDSDAAGRKAAIRSAEIALRLGMEVKIADIPHGKDPADLILKDPEAWKQCLRDAKQIVVFQLDHILVEKPDPRQMTKAIRENVLPFVAPVTSAMEKAHFIKIIHERTGIDESAIREDLKAVEREITLGTRPSLAPQTAQEASKQPTPGIPQLSRIDRIVRKLMGLAALTARENKAKADELHELIKKVVGNDEYSALEKQLESFTEELALEAEVTYGGNVPEQELSELLMNLEEDVVTKNLTSAMGERLKAEQEGNQGLAEELAKKCHTLSVRRDTIRRRI